MNARFRKARLILLCICFLSGCDYARMTNDDGYDTYETRLPEMPAGSVAAPGGSAALRLLGPGALHNPLPANAANVRRGTRGYGFFCIHCHGPGGKGVATVGQSFAPLPTDLSSRRVQSQSDGPLFYRIAFGYRRHPPLIDTMLEQDIWSVIVYLRSPQFLGPGAE